MSLENEVTAMKEIKKVNYPSLSEQELKATLGGGNPIQDIRDFFAGVVSAFKDILPSRR